MIRLQIVIPTLDQSGAEKQFVSLATRLPKSEFQTHVLTLSRGGPYEAELQRHDIPYQILSKSARFDPRNLMAVRSHLRRTNPDVILSCLFAANVTTRLVASRRAGHPRLLISERCVDSWKSGWQLWLDRKLIPRTDRLIANSVSVAQFYQRNGFPDARTNVITNGIETPPIPSQTRAELLKQYRLPEDAFVVACVGRLASQKRLKQLIWAAHVANFADRRIHLLLIGDGPQRDELIQYAKDVDATSMVRFAGHRHDAASLLHLVDVFWLGSEFEGMSNSLMESMSIGKPVIVSDIPANRELVTHDQNGWLVTLGDSIGYAQFTLKLLRDPELALRMGRAGAERMRTEFSMQKMVEQFADLIRHEASERTKR